MLNSYACAGVKDAIIAGSAKLALKFTSSLHSLILCYSGPACKQGRCPVCASHEGEKRRALTLAPAIYQQPWRQEVFALRGYTRKANDLTPIPFDTIAKEIDNVMDAYMKASEQHEDRLNPNCACIAEVGLVEDSRKSGDKVRTVVVEFMMTGGGSDTEFELLDALRYRLDRREVPDWAKSTEMVERVPTPLNRTGDIWPSEGLLFGYTKRRLDLAQRPLPITDEKRLARMASNYGDHPIHHRMFSRGLSMSDDGLNFDREAFPFLLNY